MTTPGFLSDLGLENVEDDPNAFPDGTYNAYLTNAKVQGVKNNTEKRLVLTYKLFDAGQHTGKTIDEWKNIEPGAPEREKSWLKQRLKTLGVPEERFATLSPNDLVGIAVRVTTKTKGQYRNVTNVVLGHAGAEPTGAQAAASVLDGGAPAQPATTGSVTDLI